MSRRLAKLLGFPVSRDSLFLYFSGSRKRNGVGFHRCILDSVRSAVLLCEKRQHRPILSHPNSCRPDLCSHTPCSTFTKPRRCRCRTVGLSKMDNTIVLLRKEAKVDIVSGNAVGPNVYREVILLLGSTQPTPRLFELSILQQQRL
jgi:hypothetical protein